MKLYTNNSGEWAGTQADAKRDFGKDMAILEVPTDKPTLLQFLNEYQVGGADVISGQMEMVQQQSSPSSSNAPVPGRYDVRDAVKNCDRQHLGQALASIISRLYDEMEELQ